MTASLALYALGLDWTDVMQMRADLLAALERSNAELIREFRR